MNEKLKAILAELRMRSIGTAIAPFLDDDMETAIAKI
jgi:hypothetical protein